LNVLVGCEYSGIVRDAFLRRGHFALSCDLLPTESDEGNHWQGDIHDCLDNTDHWDLIIIHPPCTALCVSGNGTYGLNVDGTPKKRHHERVAALEWTTKLFEKCARRSLHVCMENPVGVLSTNWRPASQYIQPHEYGHKEFKKTGLWLTPGLPLLQPRNALVPPRQGTPEHLEWQRVHNMFPTEDRGKLRSRFFEGVADAMAEQWEFPT
jgi:hypothetical protein